MAFPIPTIKKYSVTTAVSVVTVAITSVDTTRAIIMPEGISNDNNPQDDRTFGTYRFTSLSGNNSAEVTCQRDASGSGNQTYNFSVWEWPASSGVTVQHFDNASLSTLGATTSVTISSVDTTKSFFILSVESTISTMNQAETCRGKFTSSTNIDIICGATPPTSKRYSLQVVEINVPEVTVEHVENTWTTETSLTDTVTSVDTTKAFVIPCGFTSSDALSTLPNYGMTGVLTGATTLQMRRGSGTNGGGTSSHSIVEFDDPNVLVQTQDNMSMTATATHNLATSIDVDRSAVIPPLNNFQIASTDSTFGRRYSVRQAISSTQNVLTRGENLDTAIGASQVLTFLGNGTIGDRDLSRRRSILLGLR